ncbi:hypothetical protein Bca4012_009001 [Brassica carinata]|uniref:Secreted protein n=1 Tax=Brassica carinata TaxID=52824 RepID=A0A8X7WM71_BRACI|nr:hypothetical protein Bca52824_003181 [Brassica carinata]
MWSSMALWLLLVVPPRFVTPLRCFLSRYLRARATAFVFGVESSGVRFVLFLSTSEMESNSSVNCSSVFEDFKCASQAHLVLFGGVASLFCAGAQLCPAIVFCSQEVWSCVACTGLSASSLARVYSLVAGGSPLGMAVRNPLFI